MEQLSRRTLLASCLPIVASGCLSGSDAADRSHLGTVFVENRHHAPHTIEVRITWEGEVVHDRSYDLAGDDPDDDSFPGTVADQTWPDDPGRFVLSARIEGADWRSVKPADHGNPDCFAAVVRPDRTGDLVIGTLGSPAFCDQVEPGSL